MILKRQETSNTHYSSAQTGSQFDALGFSIALAKIGNQARKNASFADISHLRKIDFVCWAMTLIGYGTSWIFPNPLSAILIAEGSVGRWCILSHHILHKAYDKIENVPARFTSKSFAKGWRRYLDWFDLIHPKAWEYEHNILHHSFTGEIRDPDLAEDTLDFLRLSRLPKIIKYFILAFFIATWKWTYYAPGTMREMLFPSTGGEKKVFPGVSKPGLSSMLNPFTPWGRKVWLQCLIPYFGIRFILIPALFLPLGWMPVVFVLINSFLAELISNIHSFLLIVPNHTGEDIHRFSDAAISKGDFYRRQVLGSVNYKTGNDKIDFFHGWLNYQVEHHLFQDLTLLQYRKIQPEVKQVCEAFNLPYIQENLWTRVKKMTEVLVGDSSMINTGKLNWKES